MKPSEILKQYGWTQNAFARTVDGEELLSAASNAAASFCALGAMYRCYPRSETGDKKDALRSLLDVYSITEWNDAPERTKEEVIAAFEAIGE